jgi:HD-GYP domain-containing protein (c-di-GMP phosphodiesterase class II)
MGIPDRILLKPGRLTDEEEAIMREHPARSVNILAGLSHVPFIQQTLPGIRHHHERLDGKGYPDGIAGDQIPLTSRVILIADTFDAMTTTRPYRKALPEEIAFKELTQFAGRQFDPKLVKIFIESYKYWGHLEEEITETFVSSHFKRAA